MKTNQEGLLDAFLNSRPILTKLAIVAKVFYKYDFSSTKKQAKDMGCQGEFNHKEPLKTTPLLEDWKGDDNEPIDDPWRLPVLNKATVLFLSAPSSKEDLEPDSLPQYPLSL